MQLCAVQSTNSTKIRKYRSSHLAVEMSAFIRFDENSQNKLPKYSVAFERTIDDEANLG